MPRFTVPIFVLVRGCNHGKNKTSSFKTPKLGATTPGGSVGETNEPAVNGDKNGKNERHRDTAAYAAGNQGDSPADHDITQRIRQAIVSSTSSFSTPTKHVKIITVNGKVRACK
jgi:hypothetical protein